ncbi:MFS transporter [Amycolatopsis sp. NBC_01307]|uniref:MFS transporter n=1 Tax=Amycolatopsis sp. NBC_01307 TaxID=2903561 RepID=UPI002E1219A0|nr:MFS transporter [Amycolatopsis sp. NBC_01307]
MSDLISPRRRGLMMSLFGLSQGAATLTGTLLGGVLGAADWRHPFTIVALAGAFAAVAYLPTGRIYRGQSEPELSEMFASGREYHHRIDRGDLRRILVRRSNLLLILQGLPAQLVFGSLVWMPRLLQAKVEQQGYTQQVAIVVGSAFAAVFQLGGVLSVFGGVVGDRLQRRSLRGRAMVASVGVLAGIPFYVVLFFLPLRISIAAGAGTGDVLRAIVGSLLTEPTVGISFLMALLALALTSANSPNWLALIADVNLPEHRAIVYSAGNLVNSLGRSAGNGVVGAVFGVLAPALPPPLNYAVGLAAFQLFFIPTGVMYYCASRTVPMDVRQVRDTLHNRANDDGDATPDQALLKPRRD